MGVANLTSIYVGCHEPNLGYKPPLCHRAVTVEFVPDYWSVGRQLFDQAKHLPFRLLKAGTYGMNREKSQPMASYIGAIDQGTTSTRFIVFDRSGRIVSTAQKEHEQIYPKPGWVEHDPEEIWRRTQAVIHEAMEARGLQAADLAAIGITNQRETTVVWNRKSGKPMYNAIVWQDTRVARRGCRVRGERRPGPLSRQDRPSARDLFQRPEDSLDSRECCRARGRRLKPATCCSAISILF